MDEVEFNAKELFHFMNTHTDEFFIRVRFDEGGYCEFNKEKAQGLCP